MSRLMIVTQNNAQKTVEGLYKDMERRIQASQPGLCPVDLAEAFRPAGGTDRECSERERRGEDDRHDRKDGGEYLPQRGLRHRL